MPPINIIAGVTGAVIGMFLQGFQTAFLLGVAGFLLGSFYDLNIRMARLEKLAKGIQSDREKQTVRTPTQKPLPEDAAQPPRFRQGPQAEPVMSTPPEAPSSTDPFIKPSGQATIPDRPVPEISAKPFPGTGGSGPVDIQTRIIEFIKAFFIQGNLVVRIGLIVLFFGVAFLIKYAADRNMLPIELRLIGVAMGAICMLAVGWRLRRRRLTYAVLIQGGAVGILYLTIFAAAKINDLMPIGLAFFLMVSIVALSAVLAIIQNAMPLVLFGVIGGFLAPVLLSTGVENHVALFSYYTLLNAGILGIAWFKPWRVLNVIGFAFTFVIGMAWGYKYYQPVYFKTTEPFLVLFFLFYAMISILYALRQPVELKGYIDGPLVFGLPLVAFGLQGALVFSYKYGMGYSAVALGGFYIILARVLWKRQIQGMRMLTEAFLSLAVVFASLAIPLALDSTWTSGLWALEGAGLVWIGLRQKRLLARSFGLMLQLGAGVSFLVTMGQPAGGTPVFNGICMSCLIISVSALISNFCHLYFNDRLLAWEKPVHYFLLVWGLLWWFAGGINEINSHVPAEDKAHMALAFIAVSCWGMGNLARYLRWPDLQYPAGGLVFAAIFICFIEFIFGRWPHPFYGYGFIAWTMALGAQYHLLWEFEAVWPHNRLRLLHQLALNLSVFIFTWEIAWNFSRVVNGAFTWELAAWGGIPVVAVILLLTAGDGISWPIRRFPKDYTGDGLAPIMGYAWVFSIIACFFDGNPSPLGYLPLINPIEIIEIFILLTIIFWQRKSRQANSDILSRLPLHSIAYAVSAAGFLMVNAMLARSVHFFTGVSYTLDALFDSVIFQAALSIFWTLFALGIMAGATRKQSRIVWFIGATLVGVVVIKLFLVDLNNIGTVARIISFMIVGILMLVLGYFSPLPPAPDKTEKLHAG